MDAKRRANIEGTINALYDSVSVAWNYALLLASFRDAYHARPRMNAVYGRVINQYWRALWDALFTRIGTFYDRRTGTYSLPGLLTQLRRTKNPELSALASRLEKSIDRSDEIAGKFIRWRNEIVGHSVASVVPERFDEETTVHLADAEALLRRVENTLNEVSKHVTGFTTDVRHWNDEFAVEAAAFLEAVERSLVAPAPSNAHGNSDA